MQTESSAQDQPLAAPAGTGAPQVVVVEGLSPGDVVALRDPSARPGLSDAVSPAEAEK